MSNNVFKQVTFSSLLLSGILTANPVLGAEPCPWQGTENSAACAQWELMARRLEAAETRASAAENALQSMEKALQSMERALQNMAAQPASESTATTAPSSTAPPSAEEQQARALVDLAISRLEESLSYQPGSFIVNKDYTLQAEGNGYQASFNEFAVEIEDVRIDVAPASMYVEVQDADRTATALKISENVRILEDDELVATITIGNQRVAGIWSEKASNFPELQVDFSDIKVTVVDEPGQLSIARMAGTQQLEIAADEAWQQAQTFLIDSIQFDSGNNESFTLENLSGEVKTTGQQYSKLLNMGKDIQKLVDENTDIEESPEVLLDYLKSVFDLFGSYEFKVAAKNLEVLGGGASIAQIGTLNFSNQLTHQEEQGGNFGLTLELGQLASQMAPLPPELLPQQLRMQLAVNNIPPNLLERFIDMGMGSEQIPEEQQDMYWQQQLLGLLMSSQLELQVIDTYISADSARADLSLRAAIDTAAAMGGVGELNLRIAGMQTLIDITGAQQNESAAPVLAMITAFSNRTEQEGKTIDTFDLRFAADGKLFLNDKDVTAMFMPGAAPQ